MKRAVTGGLLTQDKASSGGFSASVKVKLAKPKAGATKGAASSGVTTKPLVTAADLVQGKYASTSSANSTAEGKKRGRPQRRSKRPVDATPPKWLSEVWPRRTPYFPQLDDVLYYFVQGHKAFNDAAHREASDADASVKSNCPWNEGLELMVRGETYRPVREYWLRIKIMLGFSSFWKDRSSYEKNRQFTEPVNANLTQTAHQSLDLTSQQLCQNFKEIQILHAFCSIKLTLFQNLMYFCRSDLSQTRLTIFVSQVWLKCHNAERSFSLRNSFFATFSLLNVCFYQ